MESKEVLELKETLSKKTKELECLQAVSEAVGFSMNISEMLNDCLDRLLEIYDVERGSFLVLNKEKGELNLVALRGFPDEMRRRLRRVKMGEFIIGNVAETGEPFVTKDVSKETLSCPEGRRAGTKGFVAVPLKTGNEIVGVMSLGSAEERIFSDDEIRFLLVVGAEVARAILKSKKYDAEREKSLILSTLNRVGQEISRTLDMDTLLYQIYNAVRETISPRNFTMYLLEENTGKLVSEIDLDDGVIQEVKTLVEPDKGLTQYIVKNKVSILTDDYLEECNRRRVIPSGKPVKSWLGVPMIAGDKIIGVMNVWDYERKRVFDEDDLAAMETLASQAAIGIENVRLVEKITKGKREWERTFDSITECVAIFDSEHRLLRVNKALAGMFNVAPSKFMKNYCYEFFNKNVCVLPECPFLKIRRESLKEGRDLTSEMKVEGIGKTFSVSISPIFSENGEFLGSVHVMRDITEEKALKEQLIQAERFSALGEMAAGVAHNFNNILAVILGRTELLKMQIEDTGVKEKLQTIENAIMDATEIVRRVQEFARVKSDEKFVLLDLNQVILDTIEFTKYKWKLEAESKGIRIDIETDLKEIPEISGNPAELKEVFVNLILNSYDALPFGGKIQINTIPWLLYEGQNGVKVDFLDNGIGMSEEVQRKIFTPFFTTKTQKGSGLGLSVSRAIVKRHHGEIEVRSKIGEGTNFVLYFPEAIEDKDNDRGDRKGQ